MEILMFWLIANVLMATVFVGLYAYLRWKKDWFREDHLRIPGWMSLVSIPLGFAIPASPWAMDGMIIFAAIFFGNEWLWQRFRISPLGLIFRKADMKAREAAAAAKAAMQN